MYLRSSDKILTLHWELFRPYYPSCLVAGISSRQGGVSPSPWEGLNLSSSTGDLPARVEENRKRLLGSFGKETAQIRSSSQVHGHKVTLVTEKSAVIPSLPCDALCTASREIVLFLCFADCVPLVFYDPASHAGALSHAGWRGTAEGIAQHCVSAMVTHFSSRPEKLLAGIGPAIGACCYLVGPEVGETVSSSVIANEGLFVDSRLDLKETNRRQLLEAGLLPQHIETSPECSCCRTDLFFSHRMHGPQTGRFSAFLSLS